MFSYEAQDAVVSKLGIRLGDPDGRADRLDIARDDERGYLCQLFGPFVDLDAAVPKDLRIFVVVRELDTESGHSTTLNLLVQDADDDAFLNHNAEGAEKYDVGVVNLRG